MSQHSLDFSHFDAESYFVRRLKDHGRTVFAGVSDPGIRRERIRAAILEGGLDVAIIGRRPDQKPETYAAAFQRFYGEPLEPKRKEKSHASSR
jgi:hypothetical protein